MKILKILNKKMQATKKNYIKGFTLVELAIVIVVIGLVVAGVTAGQAVVKQARLKGVITDINQFKAAYNAFRTKYNAIPGDMSNAQSYWPTAFANGNANRRLETNNERYGFWQHSALAGVIPGVYSGQFGVAVDRPEASIKNGSYRAMDTTATCYGKTGNRYVMEGDSDTIGVILAADAYSLDVKMDDGLADKGKVFSTTPNLVAGAGTECTTGSWNPISASAEYNLDVTDRYCRMLFWF